MPAKKSPPPKGLPLYRILTGPDDAAFCHRVSEALSLGYMLYGSPAATFNGKTVIIAQAPVATPNSSTCGRVKLPHPEQAVDGRILRG